jgi:hypothetical protein
MFFTAASAVLTSSRDAAALGALSYRSVDASALGGLLMPELEWVRGGEGSGIGIALPMSFRFTNWASPEGYQVSNNQRLLYGPLLTARLNRPGWEFVSRLGFLNRTENLAWILSVGRIL